MNAGNESWLKILAPRSLKPQHEGCWKLLTPLRPANARSSTAPAPLASKLTTRTLLQVTWFHCVPTDIGLGQPSASSANGARPRWETGKLRIELPEAFGYAVDEQRSNRFMKRPEIGRG
jgi:hypothetical protein